MDNKNITKIFDIGLVPRQETLAERFMFPFSQINYLLNGGCFDRVTLIVSGTDNGKAQPLYSKVQTPYGEKEMGDIKVGDIICGVDGKSQKVLGVYPQGQKEVYRVWTSDNFYTDCVGEHLWTVLDCFNNNTKIITTEEIIKGIKSAKHKGYRYALPKYEAIEYAEKNFVCDPYIMGIYLGDGCSTERQFSISSKDNEIINEVSRILKSKSRRRSDNNFTYNFYKFGNNKSRSNVKFWLTKELIPEELLNKKSQDKFIPIEYFYGSKEQRLNLLKGLMDTDGCVSKAKNRNSINTMFYTNSEQLARDVCRLVFSLGYIANYRLEKRHNRICNKSYIVNIRIDKQDNPFFLKRKAELWRPSTMNKYRKISKIEKLDKVEECVCIYVSNPDHLYLTDNYIVTHNTTFVSQIVADIIKQGYKCACFWGEDTVYESQDRIFKQSLKGEDVNDLFYAPYYANGKETNCGEWVLTNEAFERAKERFAGKLYLYNTRASSMVGDILDGFEEARIKYGCRVFVLDNCDQFEFATDNENLELKNDVKQIRDYAINNKVHIFLISHIRKIDKDVILPSLDDVKGTSSLVNIAKNVLIVVRMDKVDHSTKQYRQLHALLELNNYNLDEADCLIHVAKTKGRKIGFACLKYNKKFNTYYDCKKIDENKQETDIVNVIPPELTPLNNNEIDFF